MKKDQNESANRPLAKSLLNYLVFSFLFLSAVLFTGALSVQYLPLTQKTAPTVGMDVDGETPLVLIDPGHGGEDGGASGADGTLEKDLNLSISEGVRDLMTLFGVKVQMTREGDHMLYDYYNDLDDYSGKRKTYDLRNRLKIAENSGAQLFLGIHMNKFPQPKYSGLQVYYSPNHPDSGKIARTIQEYTHNYLQPDNTREIKKATSAIYILNRIKLPAVLVECGFLSNEAECAKLKTHDYQLQTACVIASAGLELLQN